MTFHDFELVPALDCPAPSHHAPIRGLHKRTVKAKMEACVLQYVGLSLPRLYPFTQRLACLYWPPSCIGHCPRDGS